MTLVVNSKYEVKMVQFIHYRVHKGNHLFVEEVWYFFGGSHFVQYDCLHVALKHYEDFHPFKIIVYDVKVIITVLQPKEVALKVGVRNKYVRCRILLKLTQGFQIVVSI